jgi:predicted PolB exonuclease-like 3'-5' exonuclease
VNDSARYAVLDLETRCHLPLAREVLHLDASVEPAEVCRRLVERRRSENGSDFQKLPFHEPVASAILLAERRGAASTDPLVATDWRCWKAGELPMAQFVERFFEDIAGRTYVGFNSQGFDLPLMELWASRCRVSAPEHFDRPGHSGNPRYKYGELHYDLQKELVNWAWGSGTFDELCKFHRLPGKPGVSGEDVERLVAEGRLDEVHAYNVTDVLQSHLLFLHTLLRAGKLTRASAQQSAQAALSLTREQLVPKLGRGSLARGLLERSIEGCARAPIAGGT